MAAWIETRGTSAISLVEAFLESEADAQTWNDVDIWQTVFELVPRTNPATPPIAIGKADFNTPLRLSSASRRGIEQMYDEGTSESARSSQG